MVWYGMVWYGICAARIGVAIHLRHKNSSRQPYISYGMIWCVCVLEWPYICYGMCVMRIGVAHHTLAMVWHVCCKNGSHTLAMVWINVDPVLV